MIALGQVNSASGDGSLFSFPLDSPGADRLLLVSVSYKPGANIGIDGVTYGGAPLVSLGLAQLTTVLATEVFYLIAPPAGTASVECALSVATKTIVAAATFTGVDQANPIYFNTNGIGQMVTEIPLVCQAQNGDMLIGLGACVGTSASPIEAWQTSVWDVAQASNLRSQGICSFPNFTAEFTVSNTVDPVTDWALSVLGIKAA